MNGWSAFGRLVIASFPGGGKKIFCAASCVWTLLSANLYPANSNTPATMRNTVTTTPPVDINQSKVLRLMTPPLLVREHARGTVRGQGPMDPSPPGPSSGWSTALRARDPQFSGSWVSRGGGRDVKVTSRPEPLPIAEPEPTATATVTRAGR